MEPRPPKFGSVIRNHKHLLPEPYKDTAMSQKDAAPATWTVECLPNELLGTICDLLPNSDIKNIRLASPLLGQKCQLKISRVFISHNPANIKVAMAIATHESYRLGVEEIIWDDATLVPSGGDGGLFPEYSEESDAEIPKELAVEDQKSFTWFARGYEDVFRYVIQQFPNLKRVVVTPAAHGYLFEPLYRTPMIKSFPYGFIYPVPRGWPMPLPGHQWALAMPWVGDDTAEENKDIYHGFRIVTKVLAEEKHNVTELMFDVHQLNTGINHFALNRGTEEYKNFCDILKRPGFQKLHLSLLVGFYLAEEYEIYNERYLHDALYEATDMRYLSFHTDFATNRHSWTIDMYQYTPLFDVFPIDRWQQLTYFGLSNVLVAQTDLIAFLSKLPQTVQTVELSFLTFMEGDGHSISLMEDIRDKLDWKHRPLERRVKIFAKIFCYLSYYGRYICVDKEVEEFVYNDGPQPFQLRQPGNSSDVDPGTGVLKDLFNPAWECPNDYSVERRLVFPRQQ
ncbi:hypothetical protein FDENT_8593 [Fusarium denticulatum]|uniref:F-box domain-containing protein n=1 Tax=Fusarium denticulatum TaxID=48507 RepID=A0A8H5X3L5_9HYPO|nr:hypothetical protein FDENT_8593 [Fusarium denticulatum]